jgi:hypothetical protein
MDIGPANSGTEIVAVERAWGWVEKEREQEVDRREETGRWRGVGRLKMEGLGDWVGVRGTYAG